MNLRLVHAGLIFLSAVLAVLFGLWCLNLYGRENGVEPLHASGGKCPFSAMIPTIEATQPAQTAEPAPVTWTAAAEARLAKVPEFVRPMARTGIERYARERGALEVDEQILDAARDFFGM